MAVGDIRMAGDNHNDNCYDNHDVMLDEEHWKKNMYRRMYYAKDMHSRRKKNDKDRSSHDNYMAASVCRKDSKSRNHAANNY